MIKYNINLTNKPPATPLSNYDAFVKHDRQASPQQILIYQQYIESINFAASQTRPDISFAASKLAQFLQNLSLKHKEYAEQVMQYLSHTKYYSIVYEGEVTDLRKIFLALSDSAYADDSETRWSSYGYAFELFNGMIHWKAAQENTVTTSSTEAELLAILQAAKETIW